MEHSTKEYGANIRGCDMEQHHKGRLVGITTTGEKKEHLYCCYIFGDPLTNGFTATNVENIKFCGIPLEHIRKNIKVNIHKGPDNEIDEIVLLLSQRHGVWPQSLKDRLYITVYAKYDNKIFGDIEHITLEADIE